MVVRFEKKNNKYKKTRKIQSCVRIGHDLFPAHLNRINLKADDLDVCGEQGILGLVILGCQFAVYLWGYFKTPLPLILHKAPKAILRQFKKVKIHKSGTGYSNLTLFVGCRLMIKSGILSIACVYSQ